MACFARERIETIRRQRCLARLAPGAAFIRIMHFALERNSRLTKRGVRTWRWLLVGVALVASCVALALSDRAAAPYAPLLSGCAESRTQPYLDCVSSALLGYSYRHPQATGTLLSYVFVHAREYRRRADLRPLSETAHFAGMELAALPLTLPQALSDCGYAFKAACMHGFVMERLDYKRVSPTELVHSFLSFCLPVQSNTGYYENCLHGVGHELWARTHLSLGGTLALCDAVHGEADQSACWSGVLMEYSKGERAKGHHSHTPAGKRNLPCTSLAPRFQQTCTYAEASYRQYVRGWEPPSTTYERCTTAPPAYILGCMTLVSERLLLAQSGSDQLATAACAHLRSGEGICFRSIAALRAPSS
jgi:hypothetical protein